MFAVFVELVQCCKLFDYVLRGIWCVVLTYSCLNLFVPPCLSNENTGGNGSKHPHTVIHAQHTHTDTHHFPQKISFAPLKVRVVRYRGHAAGSHWGHPCDRCLQALPRRGEASECLAQMQLGSQEARQEGRRKNAAHTHFTNSTQKKCRKC